MKLKRFTEELVTLINSQPGIKISLNSEAQVDRLLLIDLMDKAEHKPLNTVFDLPADAKKLAAVSNDTITRKEAVMVLKGLYGYKKEEGRDYSDFGESDFPKLRASILGNKRKFATLSTIFRNWK